ncbi:hypothetical protein [Spiroplasma alleghenense]|uniref:Lipoprotein n=1 Tax=Spiroplasma alleghenense TaxID=216931 RepID=A0A345Z556_9MOLU|nr:hypothetical protein [Spiroplasma alleghenense]AXK51735.1 hypothetical protein SALLE_v1c10650 [Spiroplasma alleghenense]
MKKLLSILAVASIGTSAPLSVVACKPGNRQEEEHDFQTRRNSFIALVTQIFKSKMQSFFDPFRFVYQDESPFESELTINYLRDKSEEISQGNGFAFDFVKSELMKLIDWWSVQQEVNKQVVQDVNFRSFLVDGKNPLNEAVQISSIKVQSNGSEIATMNIAFRTQISLLDGNKEVEYLPINYSTQISIIDEVGSVEELTRINKEYLNLFNSKITANYFKIESNKGNFETVAKMIDSEEGLIKKNVKSLINTIKLENDSFVINADNLKMGMSEDFLAIGSTALSYNNFQWDSGGGSTIEMQEYDKNLRKSFFGDEKAKDAVVNALSKNGLNYTHGWQESSDLQDKVAKFENMSVAISVFGVKENLSNNQAYRNKITNYQPIFAINELEDEKLISLFGVDIENTVVEFKEQTFELSNPFILVRQNTEEDNTLTLYRKFLKDALNYQILFHGLGEFYMEITNPEQTFYSKKPESWKNQDIYNKPLDYSELRDEFFDAASDETKSFQKDFEFSVEMISYKTNNKYEIARYFWIKEDESILVWSDWEYNPPKPNIWNHPLESQLATFFFSSGVKHRTLMNAGLALGKRGDSFLLIDYGDSHWKFES